MNGKKVKTYGNKIKDKKPWYKSKAKVGSLLVSLGLIGQYFQGQIDLTFLLTGIAGTLTAFGIRDAME